MDDSSQSNLISPRFMMRLAYDLERAIWKEFGSTQEIEYYISKWHESDTYGNWENFTIYKGITMEIDLGKTLHSMNGELLLKIAIDMGVETPDFIPSIPTFRNEIKSSYKTANATFERAFKQIEEHPDTSIGLANSALESIIKEIMKDERIKKKITGKETLYPLTTIVLKEFQILSESDMPMEIKTIGSSLLSINQSIEKLRSEKTNFHGKTEQDKIVEDSIYAHFVVNSVTTIGLFLISFYKMKFPRQIKEDNKYDELPF